MGKYQDNRSRRMGIIRIAVETANKEGVKVNKEKLISAMSLDFNLARRTVLEYLNTLIGAGRINESDFEGNQLESVDSLLKTEVK